MPRNNCYGMRNRYTMSYGTGCFHPFDATIDGEVVWSRGGWWPK